MRKITLFALSLFALAMMTSCVESKPVIKSANDKARQVCAEVVGAEAERAGLDVEKLVRDVCGAHEVIDPILRAIVGAQKAASGVPEPEPATDGGG